MFWQFPLWLWPPAGGLSTVSVCHHSARRRVHSMSIPWTLHVCLGFYHYGTACLQWDRTADWSQPWPATDPGTLGLFLAWYRSQETETTPDQCWLNSIVNKWSTLRMFTRPLCHFNRKSLNYWSPWPGNNVLLHIDWNYIDQKLTSIAFQKASYCDVSICRPNYGPLWIAQ